MADGGNVVQCGTLEDLATLRTSMRKHLLDVHDKEVGQLTIQYEGHEYNATRDKEGTVKVCRVDLERDFGKRLPTVLEEFFTHRVADFFCLRGVGSRASRMASIIDNWVRLPDGQETVGTPPWFMSATVTIQSGPQKSICSEDANYVQNHLANHCPKFLESVKLSKSVKKLDERDRAWQRAIAQCIFPTDPSDRGLDAALPFDMAACEAVIEQTFIASNGGTPLDEPALAALMAAMKHIAHAASADAAETPPADTVVQARLLFLARALAAGGRSPAQALAVLDALQSPGALHDHADDSPLARQCWQAARLLSGTDFGFQLLCELVPSPMNVTSEAAEQWRTGLKLYLEASNHLIAEGKSSCKAQLHALDAERQALAQRADSLAKRLRTFKASATGEPGQLPESRSTRAKYDTTRIALQQEAIDLKTQQAALNARAAQLTKDIANTMESWSACPLAAAQHALAFVIASDDAKANLLPHRTLVAAKKLMQHDKALDSERLQSEYDRAKSGADIDENHVLTPEDAFALSVWRNGFRDDRAGTPLAEYSRRLNTMLVDMLPHDQLDEAGNVTGTVWKSDSPLRVALESDLSTAVTRRLISQQAADFHAAMGSLGRLLALKLKLDHGQPLERHEQVLWDAMALRDALAVAGADGESDTAIVDAAQQLDQIIEPLIAAVQLIELEQRRCAALTDRSAFMTIDECKAKIQATKEALAVVFPKMAPSVAVSTDADLGTVEVSRDCLRDSVRFELLRCWLDSTHDSTRWKSWRVTPNVRNAVIGALGDTIDVQRHSKDIEEELDTFPQIHPRILQQWASDAGILAPSEQGVVAREINRQARRNLYVGMALELGLDKVDAERLKTAGSIHHLRPRTRQEYSELMTHLLNLNLGCSIVGEVSRSAGLQLGFGVDTGYALPGTGGLDVSVNSMGAQTTIQRGGITSSSIGAVVVQASEENRSLQSFEVGLGAKAYGVSQSVDTAFSSMESYEIGHGVRIAPTPGTRNWLDIGRPFLKAMLSTKVAALAEEDLADHQTNRKVRFGALTELCWRGFLPLLDGRLAFNLFASIRGTETISVGASTGVSVSGPPGSAKLSASLRVGTEYDVVTRQSRVDVTGSRRVAVHSIGTGSRMSVGLRFMLNLLPISIQSRFHGSISAGTVGAISATFRERGSMHAIRRETLHGTTQGNLAWDIVFHNGDDLVAHMNQEDIRKHWAEYKALRGDDPNADLNTALQSVIAHASHSNQTFMVRRQLKAAKVAEFNALTAMLDGLHGTTGPLSRVVDTHAIKARCLALLTDEDSYQFTGFGLYANDRREEHIGISGEIIKTSGEAVAVNTEQEWKSARITPELLRSALPKSAGQSGGLYQLPQKGDAEGGAAAEIPRVPATAISSLV